MNGDIELSERDEWIREWERDEAIFARQCPAVDPLGERCTYTLHYTQPLHSWEEPPC